MKLSIGSDHAGYEAKLEVVKWLKQEGYEVVDVGTNSLDSCDYPLFGRAAAELVANGTCEKGVVICSSGEGIMISANKVPGVRCGMGYNDEVSALLRQHNNANMIAFGAKFMTVEDIIKRLKIFLSTEFEGGRHQRRVDLIEK